MSSTRPANPNHAAARENLGITLFNLGHSADALRELEIAQRLAPDRESILKNLEIARTQAGAQR